MNKKTVSKLIDLNNNFYKKIGDTFNETRNYFWQGWEELYKKKYIKSPIKVLDIGCGNGRFTRFLKDKKIDFSYTGIDSSGLLLNKAKNQVANANTVFFEEDILKESLSSKVRKEKYDLIVMFGFMHHIPSSDLRNRIFHEVKQSLNENGYFIFSTWEFNKDKKYINRLVDPKTVGISKIELELGDYILDWRRGETACRYCHDYSETEINTILVENGFELVNSFLADGKSGKLNKYYIIQTSTTQV